MSYELNALEEPLVGMQSFSDEESADSSDVGFLYGSDSRGKEDLDLPEKIKVFVGWHELASRDMWRASVAELLATALFIFIGAGTVVSQSQFVFETTPNMSAVSGSEISSYLPKATPDALTAIALSHGFAIAVLVSGIAHLSGGHVNPAVSFAMIVTGNISVIRGVLYMVLQTVGSALGAAMLAACLPKRLHRGLGAHARNENISPFQGFLIEAILTFVLLFTIFGNAVDKRGSPIMAPFFIGLSVVIDHFVGIPLTGASMNPARSFGPAFITNDWHDHYFIYWFGPLVGGTAAALLYRTVFLRDQRNVVSLETVSQQIADLK